MSTQALTLYATTIGRKTAMAISGFIAVGWIFLHMLGQLGAYAGRGSYNAYAAFLYNQPGLLWGQRVLFGGAVLVHVATAISLWRTNLAARPVDPHGQRFWATNVAALTMRYGGLLLLVFLIYHVLHMTVGLTDRLGYEFVHGDAYNNLVRGLQNPWVAGFYILAQGVLGMHLYHGIWSLTQTAGAVPPALQRVARERGRRTHRVDRARLRLCAHLGAHRRAAAGVASRTLNPAGTLVERFRAVRSVFQAVHVGLEGTGFEALEISDEPRESAVGGSVRGPFRPQRGLCTPPRDR